MAGPSSGAGLSTAACSAGVASRPDPRRTRRRLGGPRRCAAGRGTSPEGTRAPRSNVARPTSQESNCIERAVPTWSDLMLERTELRRGSGQREDREPSVWLTNVINLRHADLLCGKLLPSNQGAGVPPWKVRPTRKHQLETSFRGLA